jgi:hypothetical protein
MASLKERLSKLKDSIPVSFATGKNAKAAAKKAADKEKARKKRIALRKKRPLKKPQKGDKPKRITTKGKPGGPHTPGAKKRKKK